MTTILHKQPSRLRSAIRRAVLPLLAVFCCIPFGAQADGPPVPSEMSKPMAQVLVFIILALLLMIVLLANVLSGAAQLFMQRIREAGKNNSGKILLVLFFCMGSTALFAADEPAAAPVDHSIGGLAPTSFYALFSVIFVEVVVLLYLVYNLKILLRKEAEATAAAAVTAAKPAKPAINWWDKLNSFRPIHEESNIDLGHDYDGIRELDNRLPPWWLYGFYLCIIFAGIYLWRFHVSHTAPLSREELQMAMNAADAEKEAYLKKAANKVDESTITYLSDAASLEAGKKVFISVCAACHMPDGGGNVGPNLTDAYWLHGGSMKDIFKTLKYGWPEKGMKSWKDDYSPQQLAQIASYVKSLQGTKAAKPKEPQGELYDEKAATDTAKTAAVPATK
jgi:cytochrome c oxidase cbb3-type subunit 3